MESGGVMGLFYPPFDRPSFFIVFFHFIDSPAIYFPVPCGVSGTFPFGDRVGGPGEKSGTLVSPGNIFRFFTAFMDFDGAGGGKLPFIPPDDSKRLARCGRRRPRFFFPATF